MFPHQKRLSIPADISTAACAVGKNASLEEKASNRLPTASADLLYIVWSVTTCCTLCPWTDALSFVLI